MTGGAGNLATVPPVLPREPGSYGLVLELPAGQRLQVGRLGAFDFPPGIYLYLGSAAGPGGVAARLGRHLVGGRRRHWHIDALRRVARPLAAWWATGEALEHIWARQWLAHPGSVAPAPGFGASDCRCPSHLVWLPALPDLDRVAATGAWRRSEIVTDRAPP